MPLTREAIVMGYRLMLDREPDDNSTINEKLSIPDIRSLLYDFLLSEEFISQNATFILEVAAKSRIAK